MTTRTGRSSWLTHGGGWSIADHPARARHRGVGDPAEGRPCADSHALWPGLRAGVDGLADGDAVVVRLGVERGGGEPAIKVDPDRALLAVSVVPRTVRDAAVRGHSAVRCARHHRQGPR